VTIRKFSGLRVHVLDHVEIMHPVLREAIERALR
jgi:hypothetical protein